MRKFLVVCALLLVALFGGDYLYYHTSLYVDVRPGAPVETFTKTSGREILVDEGAGFAPFEIRGVDLGAGKPGHFATEFSITREEYLRWFAQIQAMGANTIRVYTILAPDFYEAFYVYNEKRAEPLYLLQGLWLNDYVQNSHMDAYDSRYIGPLLDDARCVVDVVHGRRKMSAGTNASGGTYRRDVSQWTLGYILGVEWEDLTVAFTDHMRTDKKGYAGDYFYTSAEATPFESMLAQLGETVAQYETGRYKSQRLIAFSNWPTTDPFKYEDGVANLFRKCAEVDVEHIKTTDALLSGQFASYHIYPYYPDYLRHAAVFDDTSGENTYRAYLKQIADHHTMPVIVSEFGVPSSRGMAQIDYGRGFNQGNLSEAAQGEAIAACYRDIMDAGCAGSVVFTWKDEWFKRTWNTMHAVDLTQTAYWSDVQTNEQMFGLLAFDPGKEKSVCYVDGSDAEWTQADEVLQNDALGLSMKYDERYVYFLVRGAGLDAPVYIPIDTTRKTGSAQCSGPKLAFGRAADFLVVLDGKAASRVLVQERYDTARAMFGRETAGKDSYEFPPEKDTAQFVPIRLLLQIAPGEGEKAANSLSLTYETGKLTYGNGDPASAAYDSLADFCAGDGLIEVRIPWQMLNFSNPSDMEIHDDYYEHYGVEPLSIDCLYAGVGAGGEQIPMERAALKGWGNRVTYHERLKASYYKMQEVWAGEAAS